MIARPHPEELATLIRSLAVRRLRRHLAELAHAYRVRWTSRRRHVRLVLAGAPVEHRTTGEHDCVLMACPGYNERTPISFLDRGPLGERRSSW